jgi:mRNA-degrading endonuclease RelE of RelBE toxin-antitoxin system
MEIVALSAYRKAVKKLLTTTERAEMELALASDPLAYPVIPRTGGFRKARWGRGNRGKSGGVRVVFYYYVAGVTIYLYDLYAKNQKENLSREEENYLRRIAEGLERPEEI